MNDLQLVLIVIGGVIIVAVLVFNWWQERRFHQQVEKSFSNIQSDALLDEPLPPTDMRPQNNADLHTATPDSVQVDVDQVNIDQVDIDHDDFSIDLDSIPATAIDDKEPSIHVSASIPASASGNHSAPANKSTPANHSTSSNITESTPTEYSVDAALAQDDPVYAMLPQNNIDAVAGEAAVMDAIPANHAGIKAIFEDAFSKTPNIPNPQTYQAAPTLTHDNTAKPDVSSLSATAEAALPAVLHAQVDLIAVLHLNAEMTVAQAAKAVKNDFDDYDKQVFIHVQTPDLRWLLLSEAATQPALADQKVSGMSCSLQLADRAGPVARSVINRFQLAVESLGLDINAHAEWLNSGDVAADAVALDAFCIDVDKTMGFHLLHGENGAFTGTKLRGLAEAQGLELAVDGTFKYYDEALKKQALAAAKSPQPDFVMFNREQYPFSPEMLRSSVIKGVTFQLDIPHVSNCTEAFNHMVLVAKQMETGLHAQLVDDNNRPLGDVQIEKIRHQLKIIQATMMMRGIVPGSDVAQRLFS